MARKQFFQEGQYYIAEFPQDPTVGFEKNRRGIRRRIGSFQEFKGLSATAKKEALMQRWLEAERSLRKEQLESQTKLERNQRELRKLSLQQATSRWAKDLEITNKPSTRRFYLTSLERYIKAVGNHPVSKFDPAYATTFKSFLKKQKKSNGEPYSLANQQKHIRHLCIFYSWAYDQGMISHPVKIKNIKVPRKDMKTLDVKQLDEAIAIAGQRSRESEKPVYQRLYKSVERGMMLARHTILRSGAIWSLKLENIDLDNRVIIITEVPELDWAPKALKFPIKPINDDLYEYLKEDLKNRNPEEKWYLDNGQGELWRKDYGDLSRVTAVFFKDLNYPKMKPYHEAFRSTLITHMLLKGVPITTVQQLADHSCIQTTYRYLDTRRVKQEEAVEALSKLKSL